MKRTFSLRIQATAILTVIFTMLLSVDPSRGIAGLRARAQLRAHTIEMAHNLGLDAEALLDPEAYQKRKADEAEKERELQTFWMRERTKPDPAKLAALERAVEETEDAYAIHELAALADDVTDLTNAVDDLQKEPARGFAGDLPSGSLQRVHALERASLRHQQGVLDRFDRAMNKKLAGLPAAYRTRHRIFMREARKNFGAIARGVAKAIDAKPQGEPANIKTMGRPDLRRLAGLEGTMKKVSSTRTPRIQHNLPKKVNRPIKNAPVVNAVPGVVATPADKLQRVRAAFSRDRVVRPIRLGVERSRQQVDASHLNISLSGRSAPALRDTDGGEAASTKDTGASSSPTSMFAAAAPPLNDDLEPTLDAPLTQELVDLAIELDNDPVQIFNYVHDTIDTEIYRSSRKGAVGALAEKSGNDIDQASLLVALLRAAGIPARYERIVVRLSPQQWQDYTGVDVARQAASMLATAGLSATVARVYNANLGQTFEHVEVPMMGVRAYVPYANYRGLDSGTPGAKAWAPMLPALKKYSVRDAVDLRAGALFDFDAYLSRLTADSPLEAWEQQLRDYILAQGIECETLDSAKPVRTIVPEELPYLRAEYPTEVLSDFGTVTELSDELRESVELEIRDGRGGARGAVLMTWRANLVELYGKRITILSDPATQDDADIIEAFGGLENTPLYLVKLRQTVRVGEDVVAQVSAAQAPGTDNVMAVRFREGGRVVATVPHTPRVGSLYVWGFDPGLVPYEQMDQAEFALADAAEGSQEAELARLHLMSLRFFRRYGDARQAFTGVFHARPNVDPAEVLVSYELSVNTAGGPAVSGVRDTVLFDVGRLLVTPFDVEGDDRNRAHQTLLLGHEASALEHIVPGAFHGDGVYSAVRLVQQAGTSGVQVFTVNAELVDTVLPQLDVPESTKQAIRDKAEPGRVLSLPATSFTPARFRPLYGFISRNERTGEANYSVSTLGDGIFDGAAGFINFITNAALGNGNSACPNCTVEVASEVVLGTGSYTFDVPDLSFAIGDGVDISFGRNYHSHHLTTRPSSLGRGWIHTFDEELRFLPTGDVSYVAATGHWLFSRNDSGTWTSPPGTNASLTRVDEGWAITEPGGTTTSFSSSGDMVSLQLPNAPLLMVKRDGGGLATKVEIGTSGPLLSFEYDDSGTLARVVDRAGREVRYLTSDGLLASAEYGDSTFEFYSYSDPGLLSSRRSRDGGTIYNAYDSASRWIRTTLPSGGVRRMEYDVVRKRVAYEDERGARRIYDLNDSGSLARRIDPLGSTREWHYDENRRLTAETGADGETITYFYDPSGRLEIVANSHEEEIYSYDQEGRLSERTTLRDGRYYATTVNRPRAGVTLITRPDGTTWRYEENERERRITTPEGRENVWILDEELRPVSYTNPAGGEYAYEYDLVGNMVSETDPDGVTQSYTFDERRRITTVTRPDGTIESTEYYPGRIVERLSSGEIGSEYLFDARGNLRQTVGRGGIVTRYRYDVSGLLVEEQVADQSPKSYGRDILGRVQTVRVGGRPVTEIGYCGASSTPCERINASGGVEISEKDARGRVVSTTDPLGRFTTFDYGSTPGAVIITRADDGQSKFSYDTAENLISIESPDGSMTFYDYSRDGHRISTTDATGIQYEVEYGPLGLPLAEKIGGRELATYEYSPAGRLISRTDPLQRSSWQRDSAGRVISLTAEGQEETFSYSEDGLAQRSGPFGTVSRDYGLAGMVSTHQVESASGSDLVLHTYDELGRRVATDLSGASTEIYEYDDEGRIEAIRIGSKTLRFQYDMNGRLASIRYPNGVGASYVYDTSNQMTAGVFQREGTVILAVSYTYDELGRLASLRDSTGKQETYEYDLNDRLLRVRRSGGAIVEETYAYDMNGSIREATMRDECPEPEQDECRVNRANSLNEFGQVAESSSEDGVLLYEYDLLGRRISDGEFQYLYSRYGDLLSVRRGSEAVYESTPGPDGKISSEWGSNGRVGYLRDEQGLIRVERTEEQSMNLVRGPEGNALARVGPGFEEYYLLGRLGDRVGSTGVNGLADGFPAVSAYGEPLRGDSQTATFAGGRRLSVESLVRFGARTYDYRTHSFLTRDPVNSWSLARLSPWIWSARGAHEQLTAAYSFVAGRPTAFRDPTGEALSLLASLVILAAILLAIAAVDGYQNGALWRSDVRPEGLRPCLEEIQQTAESQQLRLPGLSRMRVVVVPDTDSRLKGQAGNTQASVFSRTETVFLKESKWKEYQSGGAEARRFFQTLMIAEYQHYNSGRGDSQALQCELEWMVENIYGAVEPAEIAIHNRTQDCERAGLERKPMEPPSFSPSF